MNNTRTADTVFEVIAGCSLVMAALFITLLIVQWITTAVPLFEQMAMPSVLAQEASKTLVAVFAPTTMLLYRSRQ